MEGSLVAIKGDRSMILAVTRSWPRATRLVQSPRFNITTHEIAVISSNVSPLPLVLPLSRYDTTSLLRCFICSRHYFNLSIIYIINFIYIIIYIKYRNSHTPTCCICNSPKEAVK